MEAKRHAAAVGRRVMGELKRLERQHYCTKHSKQTSATPRGALEEKMLEQILEMISSNKFDDEVIDEIKNQLSEDGNGTVGNPC